MIGTKELSIALAALLTLLGCCFADQNTDLPLTSRDPLFNINCIDSLRISVDSARPEVTPLVSFTGASTISNGHLIRLSRHHVIPYATLRNFYNSMLTNQHHNAFQSLIDNVINRLAPIAYGRTLTPIQIEYMPDTVHDLTANQLRQVGDVSDVTMAQQIFAWLPFNIYIGPHPSFRIDDPGRNIFDTTAYAVVGGDHAADLSRTYYYMTRYIHGGQDDDLQETMDRLIRLSNSRQTPFSFVRNQWRVRRDSAVYRFIANTRTVESLSMSVYRPLRDDEFCTVRHNTAAPQRRPRSVEEDTPYCIVGESNMDSVCANTLNILRDMYNNHKVYALELENEYLPDVYHHSNLDSDSNVIYIENTKPKCYHGFGAFPLPCD